MKHLLVIIALALSLTASATAQAPPSVSASKARIAAYMAAQGYFADLFDSKATIGKGKRLSPVAFVYPGRIGRSGGYVNCSFRLYVSLIGENFVIRARNLRCR